MLKLIKQEQEQKKYFIYSRRMFVSFRSKEIKIAEPLIHNQLFQANTPRTSKSM